MGFKAFAQQRAVRSSLTGVLCCVLFSACVDVSDDKASQALESKGDAGGSTREGAASNGSAEGDAVTHSVEAGDVETAVGDVTASESDVSESEVSATASDISEVTENDVSEVTENDVSEVTENDVSEVTENDALEVTETDVAETDVADGVAIELDATISDAGDETPARDASVSPLLTADAGASTMDPVSETLSLPDAAPSTDSTGQEPNPAPTVPAVASTSTPPAPPSDDTETPPPADTSDDPAPPQDVSDGGVAPVEDLVCEPTITSDGYDCALSFSASCNAARGHQSANCFHNDMGPPSTQCYCYFYERGGDDIVESRLYGWGSSLELLNGSTACLAVMQACLH